MTDTDPREPQPIGMEQRPAQAVEAPQIPSSPSDPNADLAEMLWAASCDGDELDDLLNGDMSLTLQPEQLRDILAWANARRDAAVAAAKVWRPIETAPKDGSRVLLLRNGHIVCGRWNNDMYAPKPRPYWSHDQERIFGTVDARQCQPTHWQPLPASDTEARNV